MLHVPPEGLDARRFETLLETGRRQLASGETTRASVTLRDALALWRGPALADLAFEPFAQSEIARLEELRLTAIESRIEADLALGRQDALVAELETLVAAHPYREGLRAQLMLALYRSGRQAEALETYRSCSANLQRGTRHRARPASAAAGGRHSSPRPLTRGACAGASVGRRQGVEQAGQETAVPDAPDCRVRRCTRPRDRSCRGSGQPQLVGPLTRAREACR